MEIFDLTAKLVLDNKSFNDALDESEKKGKKFGDFFSGVIKGIGDELDKPTLIAGIKKFSHAFMGALDSTTEYADRVDKGAKNLRLSTSMYQKLSYALEANGASINNLNVGYKNLIAIMAGDGTKKATEAFEELGIDLQDANGKAKVFQTLLLETFSAISKIEDEAQRADITQKLFGTNALNTFLDQTRDARNALYKEAEDLGLVMSDEDIKQAVETRDAMDKLHKVINQLMMDVMVPLLPAIQDIANTMIPILNGLKPILVSLTSAVAALLGPLASLVGRLFGGTGNGLEGANSASTLGGESLFLTLAGAKIGSHVAGPLGAAVGGGIGLVAGETIETGENIINSAWNNGGGATTEMTTTWNGKQGGAGAGWPVYTFDAEGRDYINWFGGAHASGLWSVPRDNYPAILHRDEMVLNRSRAEDYRNGGSGIGNGAIITAIQRLENTLANIRIMVGEKEFGRATAAYGGRRINDYIGGYDNMLASGYGS